MPAISQLNLKAQDITVREIVRNPSPAFLYEAALKHEYGSAITDSGALVALSGAKTGRSPKDKRIVARPEFEKEIWWSDVNIRLDDSIFLVNRERAVDYLNTRERLFVIDGFAGWDPRHRIKVRVICERAYHALFMRNMLIRPTDSELAEFGSPDYVIFNAGRFPANSRTVGMTSKTSIDLCFERKEMVILGTEYAGEMKKGVFTIMNFIMPLKGVLSMHCAANRGVSGDVSLFFGLSGTGKTTLSADPSRALIGDDEHCWSDTGIFNIEGGCYAKTIRLTRRAEPQIYDAIRFGAVLENVRYDPRSRAVDYADESITANTRASYPIEFIDGAVIPCIAGHPSNIIFLTFDAFGVLPPVARLSPVQAMYHFLSGYTSKVAGTEVGVKEPEATFSACFGAPFLVTHPARYAQLLEERIRIHGAKVWLVNTGYSGGGYGIGKRIVLGATRAIIDAIHSGELEKAPTAPDQNFRFTVPQFCPGVPTEILNPRGTWDDGLAYDDVARSLGARFRQNFEKFGEKAKKIAVGGP